jgi:RNA polymerase sigma-70 factor (ECF subfamily)
VAVEQVTEHLFRHESGKLVSVLTGIFGIERLQLVEDVVQEALVRAFQTWPYDGVPDNPAAWLMQTARNRALDAIRREKLFHTKQTEITATIEQRLSEPADAEGPMFDDEIKDGRLRLIFACCHPVLPPEAQTALALKTLCGFSPGEIAKAFLTSEAAVAKRLTRARQKLQEEKIAFEIPAGAELSTRLDGVRQTLYLLFNEGYKASGGDTLVRVDLCDEAIRLASILAGHPAGDRPRTHALLALMLLNAARHSARTDEAGNMLRLRDQDRSRWDRALIARGVEHLGRSATGEEISTYHLEAGIASCHCMAPSEAATDWPRILSLYDRLLQIDGSPIVALNRAVALANVQGPEAGIEAVECVARDGHLESYYLLHAVLGEFEARRSRFPEAAAHLRRALELTELHFERTFLENRLAEYESASPARSLP